MPLGWPGWDSREGCRASVPRGEGALIERCKLRGVGQALREAETRKSLHFHGKDGISAEPGGGELGAGLCGWGHPVAGASGWGGHGSRQPPKAPGRGES